MARGSPDWTQLIDNAYTRYEYHRPYALNKILPVGNKYQLIDADMTGIFGWCFTTNTNAASDLRVEIDGREIFSENPSKIFYTHGLNRGGLNGDIGINIFDKINELYGIWFHAGWQIYFYKHLLVEVHNFTVNPCTIREMQAMYGKFKPIP